MTEEQDVTAPGLFWAVAVMSVLWNAIGAYDFVMTNVRDPDYLDRFPPAVMQMIDAFPYWVTAAWACGVFGGVAGGLLLLLRSRYAVLAFALSLLGLAGVTFYQFGLDLPAAARGAGANAHLLLTWLIAVILSLYSFRWERQGLLR